MINELKNRLCGLFRIGREIQEDGRILKNEHRVFSRVFRLVTVKTSLLIQRCKTISRYASNTKLKFNTVPEWESKREINIRIQFELPTLPPVKGQNNLSRICEPC